MYKNLKKYDNCNVLVTGGAGFIGSHLVEKLLTLGARVSVIDTMLCGDKIVHLKGNKNLSVHELDVTDAKAIAPVFKGIDMVFHLAAVVGVEETQTDPLNVLNVEVIGTSNVIALAAKHKVKKFIFASSSEVYGDSFKPMVEEGPFNHKSTYSLTKMIGEHYCRAYYQKCGLEYTILRYFNTYGPRQDDRFVFSRFVERALKQEDIFIYGDGNQTRDFTYVEDSVHLSLLAATSEKGVCQAFNVGTGKAVSINTLADIILKALALKRQVKVLYVDYDNIRSKEIEIFNRLADMHKALELLKYSPATTLERGLKEYVDWYRSHKI
jgi:nucleoside-diphosphate-sugar epimerase